MPLTRREFVVGAVAVSAAVGGGSSASVAAEPCTAPAVSRLAMRGANLAGAEFGSKMPGIFGQDYIYPATADIEELRRLGFNTVRLPFRWERLQPLLDGPFDAAEWQRLSTTVSMIEAAGMRVVIDVHNFARRRVAADGFAKDHLIGSGQVPTRSFVSFWSELAERFKTSPDVALGLMNEPYGIAATDWLPIVNATVSAIRARGAQNLILVPGVAYTGAHSWLSSGNEAMAGVVDPSNNFAIEVHQYLDADSSGTSAQTVSSTIGSQRIAAFQGWARQNGLRAFLGEFAAGNDATGRAALIDLMAEMERNGDVWIGWTAWAAGPWWPNDYIFRIGGSSPPDIYTRTLSEFARGAKACGSR